jgi:hypothetical protein
MGIQAFTPSSGGLPGLEFINQVVLTTANRTWAQSGAAGTYTIKSASASPGYVYFVGASTVGGPLNGVIVVPASFTSINIIGSASDLVSLYKISSKTTSALSTTATYTTYTSTTTGVSLTTNKTGFIDALVIAGGGGNAQHGAGGGAGGLLLLNSFPLTPGSTFDVQVGAAGSRDQNGGDSIFAGTTAKGGGGGLSDPPSGTGKDGGSGGGGNNSGAGGKSIQGSGVSAVSTPILFYSSFGTTASAGGYGNSGGAGTGADHRGGGGGGAGGQASGRDGGPGLQLSFTGTPVYYAAGGYGGSYPSSGNGSQGTGWSSGGYGMGGCANQTTTGPAGTQGVVIVRSYNF